MITNQKPLITKTKKSITTFHLHKNIPINTKITLHNKKIYKFLNKLISISLPHIHNFQNISKKTFNKHNNYTLNIKKQLIFPKINYNKINKIKKINIIIITTTNTNKKTHKLLTNFNIPFHK